MRPQKVDDKALMEGLMAVLRAKGYDGASLNELASACGLQKASLYHRFPGGKKDIALAVLAFVGQWTEEHIFRVLRDETYPCGERLFLALKNTDIVYHSGEASCLLRALSMDSGLELFGQTLKESMEKWIEAFQKLGQDWGLDESAARNLGMQVLIKIQGSLVVSKTLGDTTPFQNALGEIEAMYQAL